MPITNTDCFLLAHSASLSTKQELSSATTKQSEDMLLHQTSNSKPHDQSMAQAQEYVDNLVASCYSSAAMDYGASLESTLISLKPTIEPTQE